MQLRKIRVYGSLAKFLGRRSFEAAVSSASEAIRFLLANFPALEHHMADQRYQVLSDGYALADEGELTHPFGAELCVVPVLAGAGGSPVGRIFMGAALIAASLLLGPGGLLAGKIFNLTLGSSVATMGVGIGSTLVLGGVSQLLTPVPRNSGMGDDSNDDPRRSYSFSGVQQSSRQGVPIPLVYGWDVVVGSIVISAGIDTVQVSA